MLVKLVQGTLLDVATDTSKLDFSRLNGFDGWEIGTIGSGLSEPVACVRWEPSDRYLLQVGETVIRIPRHDLIIPVVICELKRLSGLLGPQPTIYVLSGYSS